MKPLSSTLLFGALLLCPAALSQGAVNPAIIPAEARWVVYADMNALRDSTLGREFIAMFEKVQFDNSVRINVPKVMATVGTVTAYGSNFSPDPEAIDGTLVLQGTPDLRKITEGLLLQQTIASPENFMESKDLPFTAYRLRTKHNPQTVDEWLYVAFPPEQVVLVSRSKSQILKARDAFRGSAASVAKTKAAPLRSLLESSRHAYLFGATIVPSESAFAAHPPQARILKMTNSGAIAVGEDGPNTFARAELLANSDEMADKLMKILQGMAAMFSLAETSDKQLAEFLNSAAVSRNEKVVSLNVTYPSDRLVQMVKSLQQTHPRKTPEDMAAARDAQLVSGTAVDQWHAEPMADLAEGAEPPLRTRIMEKVALKNGSIISLGRRSNGGKIVKFERIEISPVGGGTPLTFRSEFMRRDERRLLWIFEFPGADGTYDLKVAYTNDPTGKARYAVSVRDPGSAADAKAAPTNK